SRKGRVAGAYIAQAYGKPNRGLHAVQIEIDRALYMDEAAIVQNDRFEDTRMRVTAALAQVIEASKATDAQHLAAE
ncbi:MAG: N-formylglutamate amidohydrolase, partial [Paracoccaceae bacterium]